MLDVLELAVPHGAGSNAKEIMVPKIEVMRLEDYTRNVGYKTGSVIYEVETKTFNYG